MSTKRKNAWLKIIIPCIINIVVTIIITSANDTGPTSLKPSGAESWGVKSTQTNDVTSLQPIPQSYIHTVPKVCMHGHISWTQKYDTLLFWQLQHTRIFGKHALVTLVGNNQGDINHRCDKFTT